MINNMISVQELVAKVDGQSALADKLGISPQTVQQWVSSGAIPPKRIPEVSILTGIPKHEINSDLWPPEEAA